MGESAPLVAVVDDEPGVCRALGRLLRSAGFEVVTFTEGTEFLKFVDERKVDCAVFDLHMPHLGGLDLQSRLDQAGKRVPVVLITGQESQETQRRAMEAGAVAYLRKPTDEKQLVAAVAKGIGRAS
ncbi:MAG TPA: response regulator [Humisphaera sp.]|jgi:FixJ family two-component response regulator|nr:response regulator [Humisphaera sp.]